MGRVVRALEYFGKVLRTVVRDNLRAGVRRAHRSEPDVQRTYLELVRHYGMAVVPAQPDRPRDKAEAEAGVLLAALQGRAFGTGADYHAAVDGHHYSACCFSLRSTGGFSDYSRARAGRFFK